jgi:hypothetical protein
MPNPVHTEMSSPLDEVLMTKSLNQSGEMRPSIIRADHQPSIAIIFRYKELSPDRQ